MHKMVVANVGWLLERVDSACLANDLDMLAVLPAEIAFVGHTALLAARIVWAEDQVTSVSLDLAAKLEHQTLTTLVAHPFVCLTVTDGGAHVLVAHEHSLPGRRGGAGQGLVCKGNLVCVPAVVSTWRGGISCQVLCAKQKWLRPCEKCAATSVTGRKVPQACRDHKRSMMCMMRAQTLPTRQHVRWPKPTKTSVMEDSIWSQTCFVPSTTASHADSLLKFRINKEAVVA